MGRAPIEQAKGILMAVHQITADAAFDLLRAQSQRSNTRLRDLAASFVATQARQPITSADPVVTVVAAPNGSNDFQSAFDHAPIGMAISDPSGVLLTVNPVLVQLLGGASASLVGTSLRAATHPEDVVLPGGSGADPAEHPARGAAARRERGVGPGQGVDGHGPRRRRVGRTPGRARRGPQRRRAQHRRAAAGRHDPLTGLPAGCCSGSGCTPRAGTTGPRHRRGVRSGSCSGSATVAPAWSVGGGHTRICHRGLVRTPQQAQPSQRSSPSTTAPVLIRPSDRATAWDAPWPGWTCAQGHHHRRNPARVQRLRHGGVVGPRVVLRRRVHLLGDHPRVRTPVRCTPASRSRAVASSASSSVPTAPTRAVRAPSRPAPGWRPCHRGWWRWDRPARSPRGAGGAPRAPAGRC